MSNVKQVSIIARIPYNVMHERYNDLQLNEYLNYLESKLGMFTLNAIQGIRVYTNVIGDKIELQITGIEAVSDLLLENLVFHIKQVGGQLREARYWDIENHTGPHSI